MNDLEGRPEEVREYVGSESREVMNYMEKMEERARQEEELFTRAPLTKVDKKKMKHLKKSRNGLLGLTESFYDEIKALPMEGSAPEQVTDFSIASSRDRKFKKRKDIPLLAPIVVYKIIPSSFVTRMVDKVYTLTIHCRGKCKRLKNVDKDKYSYIDFLSDIREIHNVCDDGMLKISCSVDDSEVLMNITGDNDVLNMFSRNKNRTEFEVFEELCRVEKGVNEGEGSEEVEGSENEELSQTEGTESGESESWDEKKSGEKSDETGDELSNYISDDHCESKNESDSDFEDDPLQGSFGGVLLAAIGLDGNNGLFPVAFAIAESERKESWSSSLKTFPSC
ncbi:hypothetical protein Sango_0485100 [Sesamum angolense]|uniref:Uncharacterized protein n=1 Tax=Sesamum angolense TaxID=2727404 RepID=A0AAE2C4R5_9LAMI|nr:hypothetical protein Sango_0485100 [Sesamum angolense]